MKHISKIGYLLFFVPSLLFAHTGVDHSSGILHGMFHPLSGIDHLLTMLAVGLWAYQIGGRAIWFIPLTFVCSMIFGFTLSFYGIYMPLVEFGIMLSVIVSGLFIAYSYKIPVYEGSIIIAVFAMLHGYAHGMEISNSIQSLTYILGFSFSTVVLHSLGVLISFFVHRVRFPKLSRYIGVSIAFSGVYLMILFFYNSLS